MGSLAHTLSKRHESSILIFPKRTRHVTGLYNCHYLCCHHCGTMVPTPTWWRWTWSSGAPWLPGHHHLPTQRHLGSFYFFTVRNRVAVDITGVMSLVHTGKGELWDGHLDLNSSHRELFPVPLSCSPKWWHEFTVSLVIYMKGFLFLTFLYNTWSTGFFKNINIVSTEILFKTILLRYKCSTYLM